MDRQPAPTQDVLSHALESLDAAAASLAEKDLDSALDDVLAARLLLSTLLRTLPDQGADVVG